jgi:hypothetical protein
MHMELHVCVARGHEHQRLRIPCAHRFTPKESRNAFDVTEGRTRRATAFPRHRRTVSAYGHPPCMDVHCYASAHRTCMPPALHQVARSNALDVNCLPTSFLHATHRERTAVADRAQVARFVHHELECTTNGSYTEAHFCCAWLHSTHTEVTLGTKNNMKIEILQDRLPPVLGVMCNALLLDTRGRGLSTLALANKHSRVDQDAVAYSGNVIDQISENMANCIRGHQNSSPSVAELRGWEVVTVLPFGDFA